MEVLNFDKLPVKYVKLLNEITDEIKDDFHELVERIHNSTDGSIDWVVNSLLSRSNYLSTVFINLAYVELTKKVLKKESLSKIIVQNSAQKMVLKSYVNQVKYEIEVYNSESIERRVKNKLFPYKSFVQNIYESLLQIKLKDRKRKKSVVKINGLTLIDTFFIPSMFNNGKYTDRYYSGLIDYLTEEQKQDIFFQPTILIRKKLKEILQISEIAREQFLFQFDFLQVRDYLYALLGPLRIKRKDFSKFTFRGMDVSPILKTDFYKNISNNSSFNGILKYLLFKRLKQNNIKLRFVVNWFENQVIDRGFNKGVKVFYPNVPIVGYQGFIVSQKFNFHLQPTKIEFVNKVIPDKIAVVGRGLVDGVKKYCPELQVVCAPAFRFDYIHRNKLKIEHNQNSLIKVLVALPITVSDSVDIIRLVMSIINEEVFSSIEFIIKPHPALEIKKVIAEFNHWPNSIGVFKRDFSEIINKSDLMIGSLSSTCVESLAYGVPVIVIGSQRGVTQNPIPESIPKTMWDLCYTKEELVTAIHRFCDESIKTNSEHERSLISKQVREKYFEQVTKESVSAFLNL